MKKLLLVLLLISLSFSSLIWQASTGGSITDKPVISSGLVAIASSDGKIYAFNPDSGTKKWSTFVGLTPNEIFAFGNSFISSIRDGKVVKIGQDGNVIWSVNLNDLNNVSVIYGAATNQRKIFVTTDNGVYVLENDGSATKIFDQNSSKSPPTAGIDYVLFGAGNEFFKVKDNGQIIWRTKINSMFWTSQAAIDSSTAYVGALDGSLHAFSLTDGAELWQVRTSNWIMGSPVVQNAIVYFGDNNGAIYSVDAPSGTVLWKTQTPLAIEGALEFGSMGGKDVLFAGGTDKSAYAIDKQSGNIVWKGSASGAVGSPVYYKNSVIFGAADDQVYAFTTERACSIVLPTDAANIGIKELKVSGNYVSEAGGASVSISINGGDWMQANTTVEGWRYYINPKTSFNSGLNTVSCKVVDSAGEESGQTFTSITVNFDPNAAPGQMAVTIAPNPVDNQPFTIYVNDADNGAPIENFNLTIGGKTYQSDTNLSLTLPSGDYPIAVTKIGFNEVDQKITVSGSGPSPIFLVVVVIVIAVVAQQIYGRFIKKK